MTVSPARRTAIIDALRRGTVPADGLDQLAVGLDRLAPVLGEELDKVAGGAAVFKAVRGEYGSGKTFFAAEAKKYGLIDHIGSQHSAIDIAIGMSHAKNYKL